MGERTNNLEALAGMTLKDFWKGWDEAQPKTREGARNIERQARESRHAYNLLSELFGFHMPRRSQKILRELLKGLSLQQVETQKFKQFSGQLKELARFSERPDVKEAVRRGEEWRKSPEVDALFTLWRKKRSKAQKDRAARALLRWLHGRPVVGARWWALWPAMKRHLGRNDQERRKNLELMAVGGIIEAVHDPKVLHSQIGDHKPLRQAISERTTRAVLGEDWRRRKNSSLAQARSARKQAGGSAFSVEDHVTILHQIPARKRRQLLVRAMLTHLQSRILNLYLQGDNSTQIALKLQCSPSTVRVIKARCFKKIAKVLVNTSRN